MWGWGGLPRAYDALRRHLVMDVTSCKAETTWITFATKCTPKVNTRGETAQGRGSAEPRSLLYLLSSLSRSPLLRLDDTRRRRRGCASRVRRLRRDAAHVLSAHHPHVATLAPRRAPH